MCKLTSVLTKRIRAKSIKSTIKTDKLETKWMSKHMTCCLHVYLLLNALKKTFVILKTGYCKLCFNVKVVCKAARVFDSGFTKCSITVMYWGDSSNVAYQRRIYAGRLTRTIFRLRCECVRECWCKCACKSITFAKQSYEPCFSESFRDSSFF